MLFSKKQATVIEKMNKLANVTVTDEKVRFSIDYSDHSVAVKEIPGLVSDLIQIYGLVKPQLDAASEEANKDKKEGEEELDLSQIPF